MEAILEEFIERAYNNSTKGYSNCIEAGINPFDIMSELDPRVVFFIKESAIEMALLSLRHCVNENNK